MSMVTRIRAVFGLMTLVVAHSIAVRAGTDDPALPAKIKAMNFDSVFVLSIKYPKSPLIIGYNRVLHIDTNEYSSAIDTTVLYHGVLLNKHGVTIAPYTVYNSRIIISKSCNKALLVVHTSDYWFGYDLATKRQPQYMFDVLSDVPIDSGTFQDLMDSHFIACFRWDEDATRRGNLLDPCRGYVFRWTDPFTKLIDKYWHDGKVVRVVTQEEPTGRRIYDLQKKPIVDVTFKALHAQGQHHDALGDPWYYEVGSVYVYYDMDDWMGYVNPVTGRIGPDRVLSFETARWWFCQDYGESCIHRMRLEGVRNRHPVMPVRQAQVRLTLTDSGTDRVVYKRAHWIDVNLYPGEVGSSQEFMLNERVFLQGGVKWDAEVISYR